MAFVNYYISIIFAVATACLFQVSAFAYAAPSSKNITIEVPAGTTTQKGLVCYPSTWVSVLAFYVGNYFAHAATVRSDPGVPPPAVAARIILSLFFRPARRCRG